VSTDLNLRLELARAQVGQLVQASLLRVARLELGRRVGAAGPVDAAPLDTAAAPELPITLADAVTEAAQQGPAYRVAAADERAANAAYRFELGNYLPHAALTLNAIAVDTAFYPKLFKQTTVTLGFSFPIWNNGQRELNLSRARTIKIGARATREDMDRAVPLDVPPPYEPHETARASAAGAMRRPSHANFRAADPLPAVRPRSSTSLRRRSRLQADAARVQADYARRLARRGLESILGRRLTDKGNP
jgi:outer membrane protein TolC